MNDYTTSVYFRQETMRRYKNVETNIAYRTMLSYQLHPYYDPDDDRAIIPAKLIASIEGIEWSKDYVAIDFLEAYRRDVFPRLRWSNWSKQDGKSRRIVDNGWDYDYEILVQQERLGAFDDTGKVWFVSGKLITNKSLIAARTNRKVEAMTQLIENKHNEDMEFIATYLNNTPVNTFTKTLNRNMPDAKLTAADMVKSLDRKAQYVELKVFAKTMSILRALETYPQDHYIAVEGGTSRLFAITSGIQNLPRKVRKALTNGWIEVDLKAAQTAINAKIWEVTSVHEFLANPDNKLWATIANDIGFELTESTKEAIKKAFYTLQFGGQLSTVKAEFTKRMRSAGYEISAERFINHWIVKAMYEGRERFVADMVKHNGAYNYYGKWFSLDDYDYKTILSHIATSYEMALIRPVFDLAQDSNDFLIVLYQFDGLSIHITDKARQSQILKRISAAVIKKARELGINTQLEW